MNELIICIRENVLLLPEINNLIIEYIQPTVEYKYDISKSIRNWTSQITQGTIDDKDNNTILINFNEDNVSGVCYMYKQYTLMPRGNNIQYNRTNDDKLSMTFIYNRPIP